MSPDNQKDLFTRYPDIFVEAKLSARESCMGRGIETGDGWMGIIDNLCAQLTLFQRATRLTVRFLQVKEKFGGLRIYHQIDVFPEGSDPAEMNHWSHIVSAIISDAECRSDRTCEETGEYGEQCVRNGWYKTLSTTKAKELGFITMNEYKQQLNEKRDEALKEIARQETLS